MLLQKLTVGTFKLLASAILNETDGARKKKQKLKIPCFVITRPQSCVIFPTFCLWVRCIETSHTLYVSMLRWVFQRRQNKRHHLYFRTALDVSKRPLLLASVLLVMTFAIYCWYKWFICLPWSSLIYPFSPKPCLVITFIYPARIQPTLKFITTQTH